MIEVGWAALLISVAVWAWVGPRSLVPALDHRALAPAADLAALRLRSAEVGELCDRLATALDAGLAWPAAWSHATGCADACVYPADPAAREALVMLRAALRLTEATGVPAAAVLRAVAIAVRDRADAEAARRAAVSGPVAAARIVAGLPIAGPVVGAALGIDPVGALTGTVWGQACAIGGALFLVAGAAWSRRLVVRARSWAHS